MWNRPEDRRRERDREYDLAWWRAVREGPVERRGVPSPRLVQTHAWSVWCPPRARTPDAPRPGATGEIEAGARTRDGEPDLSALDEVPVFRHASQLDGAAIECWLGDAILSWDAPGGPIHYPLALERVRVRWEAAPRSDAGLDPFAMEFPHPDARFGDNHGRVPEGRWRVDRVNKRAVLADWLLLEWLRCEEDAPVLDELRRWVAGRWEGLPDEAGLAEFLSAVAERGAPPARIVDGRPPEPVLCPVPTLGRGPVLLGPPPVDAELPAPMAAVLESRDVPPPPAAIEFPSDLDALPVTTFRGTLSRPFTHDQAQTWLAEGRVLLLVTPDAETLLKLRDRLPPHRLRLCQFPEIDLFQAGRPIPGLPADITQDTPSAVLERPLTDASDGLGARDAESAALDARGVRLNRVIAHFAEERERLALLRSGEVLHLGERIPFPEVERRVAEGRAAHDWIPAPVEPDAPLPLSPREIEVLYAQRAEFSRDDERALRGSLPSIEELPAPAVFAERAARVARFGIPPRSRVSHPAELEDPFWRDEPAENPLSDAEAAAECLDLADRCAEAARALVPWPLWKPAALSAGWRGGSEAAPWIRLHALVGRAAHEPILERDALELAAWLLVPLGLPDPRVGWDDVHMAFRDLQARIKRVREYFDWSRNTWAPLRDRLDSLGFRCELFERARMREHPDERAQSPAELGWELLPHRDLFLLRDTIERHLAPALKARARALALRDWETFRAPLARLLRLCGDAPVAEDLRQAVDDRDPAAYERAHRALAELLAKRPALRVRDENLRKLAAVAPAWAAAIRRAIPPHDRPQPPGDPLAAWTWRTLRTKLLERAPRSADEIDEILRSLRERKERLDEQRRQALERAAAEARPDAARPPETLASRVETLAAVRPTTDRPIVAVTRNLAPILAPRFDVMILIDPDSHHRAI